MTKPFPVGRGETGAKRPVFPLTQPIPQPVIRTRHLFGCTVKIMATGRVSVYDKRGGFLGFFTISRKSLVRQRKAA